MLLQLVRLENKLNESVINVIARLFLSALQIKCNFFVIRFSLDGDKFGRCIVTCSTSHEYNVLV